MFCTEAYALSNRTVWLNLTKNDCNEIVVGNLLAHAVNKVFRPNEGDTKLLDFNASYRWQIGKLAPYTRLPGLVTVVLSGAEHFPAVASDFLSLQSSGCKIILISEERPDIGFPGDGCVISRDELRMTRGEVLGAVPGLLRQAQLEAIWRAHAGKPLETEAAIAAELGTTLYVPGPRPPYFGQFDTLAPELVVNTLLEEKEYEYLLSYVIERIPEQLTKVLPIVGRHFVDKGRGIELFEALSSVPKPHRRSGAFITWLLRGAIQAEQQSLVIDEVLSYCENHDLPDALTRIARCQSGWSRARRQELLDRSHAMANQTPFSIGYRLMLGQDRLCLPEALRALELAEREGHAGDVNEAMLHLGQLYATGGNLRRGREWFLRAREHARAHRLTDFRVKLVLANQLLAIDMLLAEASEEDIELFLSLPFDAVGKDRVTGLYRQVCATRIEALLMRGWTDEAVRAGRQLYIEHQRVDGVYDWRPAELYTRSLRAAGQFDEAHEIVRTVQYVQTDSFVQERWLLLNACNLVEKEPEKSLALCHEYFADPLQASYIPEESISMAVAYLYLVEQQDGQIRLELLDGSTRALLTAIHPDALKYMATPVNLYAAFVDRLFDKLGSESNGTFRGTELYLCSPKPSLKIDGLARKLTPREAELLFVLWRKPGGMSHEALHAFLYPENESTVSAVRQLLFRLRNKGVGIDERLRLTGPVRVDLDRPSLNYKALLPFSQVPFIVARRAEREEEFRQQLLRSDDSTWVLKQLESFDEDIELNEHALQLLPPHDPRRAALTRRLRVLQAD